MKTGWGTVSLSLPRRERLDLERRADDDLAVASPLRLATWPSPALPALPYAYAYA